MQVIYRTNLLIGFKCITLNRAPTTTTTWPTSFTCRHGPDEALEGDRGIKKEQQQQQQGK